MKCPHLINDLLPDVSFCELDCGKCPRAFAYTAVNTPLIEIECHAEAVFRCSRKIQGFTTLAACQALCSGCDECRVYWTAKEYFDQIEQEPRKEG